MQKKKTEPDYKKLLKQWKEYLKESRLSAAAATSRARELTRKGMKPPND